MYLMLSLHTDMFLINFINRQHITSANISLFHHITQYASYSYMCTLTNVCIQCRVQYSVTHASVSYISVNNTLLPDFKSISRTHVPGRLTLMIVLQCALSNSLLQVV